MDNLKPINAFDDLPTPVPDQQMNQPFPSTFPNISVGAGDSVLHVDDQGLWLGSQKNENAPFSVDMQGNMAVKKATFTDATGTTIIDPSGIISSANFTIATLSESALQAFVNTSYFDVTGQGSITLTLPRAIRAIIILSVISSSEQIVGGSDCSGRTSYRVNSTIDGELVSLFYDAFLTVSSGVRENIISKPYSKSGGFTLSAGPHTITLQSKISGNTNFRSIMDNFNISIVLLGS